MAYDYQKERPAIFTDEGQQMLMTMWDTAQQAFRAAGAVRMDRLMRDLSGDDWMMLACADRLVELRRMREITPPNTIGQHRVFVAVDHG